MKKTIGILVKTLLIPLLALSATVNEIHGECDNALPGWHILAPGFADDLIWPVSGAVFEWDYLMVHDKNGSFTGSMGIVVADPQNRLTGLMPSGANAAVSGKFASGDVVVDYLAFGSDSYTASAQTRSFYTADSDGRFARIEPLEAGDSLPQRLHWTGKTEKFEYDLMIAPDWLDRCDAYLETFPVIIGNDASGTKILGLFDFFPGQSWTIDMHWMRTQVSGWIRNRATGELATIDGWGYRENAWGPWAFVFSGWDFGIASDNASGIQWSWQSYHHSDKLDYLDVSFYDNNELKAIRFDPADGELGWYHDNWCYDNRTQQCTPLDTTVIAMNEDYIVETEMVIGLDQAPMLSDTTPITAIYFIQTLYPKYTVTIRRAAAPHETVAGFENIQGGGEFSGMRYLFHDIFGPKTEDQCVSWGKRYAHPLPVGYTTAEQ